MQYYSAVPGAAAPVYSMPAAAATYASSGPAAYTYSNAPSASGASAMPAAAAVTSQQPTSYGAVAAYGNYGVVQQQPQYQQAQLQQPQPQANYTLPNTYQYVTDDQGNKYSVQSYAPAAQQQAYGGYTYSAPQQQQAPEAYNNNNLQSLPSMVAYPGAPGYYPTSITQAWDHHVRALESGQIASLMTDFDDSSVVRFFNFTTSDRGEHLGTANIREFFDPILKDIKDKKPSVELAELEESSRTVFACWRCLQAGYTSVSNTYTFGQDCKIKSLNIALTKEATRPSTRSSKKKNEGKKTKSFCWGS